MSEFWIIKKVICIGEKERWDLMYSLVKLIDSFKNSCFVIDFLVDFFYYVGVFGDVGVF